MRACVRTCVQTVNASERGGCQCGPNTGKCESARRWEGDGGNTWGPETGTTVDSGLEQVQAEIRQVAGGSDVRGGRVTGDPPPFPLLGAHNPV